MSELLDLNNDKQIAEATKTIMLYKEQIASMQSYIDDFKEQAKLSMQKNNLKEVTVAGMKFNRIQPTKKVLRERDVQNYIIELGIEEEFKTWDTKKIKSAFPEFVDSVDGTEYIKITSVEG